MPTSNWLRDVGSQPRFPGARKWLAPSAPIGRHFSQNAPLAQSSNLHTSKAVPIAASFKEPVPERPQRLAVKPSSAPALRVQASSFLDQLRPQLLRPWIPNSRRCLHFCPRSGRFRLYELRVSRTFLDQLRPPTSQAMDTQLKALPTLPVPARGVSGCMNSAFLGLF
jgi:hypothetical protein